MIDENRITNAEYQLSRAFYKVIKTDKKATISIFEDDTAYRIFEEDITENISHFKNDIIFLENRNTRDYGNIFKDISFNIDISRLKLTKKEREEAENIDMYFTDGEFFLGLEDKLEEKIKSQLSIYTIEARGYSQGDRDTYTCVYYKNTKKQNLLKSILDNLENLFTVSEYYINEYTIETREYKDKTIDTVDILLNSYGDISYDGSSDQIIKNLKAEGYTNIIEDNN